MDISLFKKLLQEQLISASEFENIDKKQREPLSVYWDVCTLLYLGILLFTSGLGILVYKNFDLIGHSAIITIVASTCIACFIYCFKKAGGYSNKKIESPNVLFDYVLLLGCLLLLTFVGYLQFAYNVFRNDWRLATFVTMVLLFVTAYYFDHLGALSMAITNLAAWAGFTVAPIQIIRENDFRDEQLIYTGLILGAGLVAISFASTYRKIKVHFAFTYKNFGAHILFISLLAALFHFNTIYLVWFVILLTVAIPFFSNALNEKSFYFLVITVLYCYIGLSYVTVDTLFSMGGSEAALYISFIYFIASGIALIRMLIHFNKMLKKNAYL